MKSMLVALALGLGTVTPLAAAIPTTASPAIPANYAELAKFFAAWRVFAQPTVTRGAADYSAAAMAAKMAALPEWRRRLEAIDRTGWPEAAKIDWQLVQAELNGMDFDFRVLKPWARDPTFYANVFNEWSDVPAHEGSSAYPNINLYDFAYPLKPTDETRLTTLIAAIPANLAAAKINLQLSTAHDLWAYGDRAFKEQGETLARLGEGRLVMRTLDGQVSANLKGASPKLLAAIRAARAATDEFATWVAAGAAQRTGPTGVGKDNYNWYLKHVALVPYDWDQQATLLQRELDRSISALRLEEVRNRKLPPISPIEDPAAYKAMVAAKEARFSDFLAETGLSTGAPWEKTAVANQIVEFAGPDTSNFFAHVTRNDPLPLISHFSHWIDLARMREAPHASPIRRVPPLYNIYSARSEGFATAFEEIVMQAGLYDDVPHGRELVWIMLANRAARGLASLHIQSNEIDLATAGRFHASWTPRKWSDATSQLVGFEQLLYARQPGYGPSYIVGKLQLDHLLAEVSHADELAGRPFDLGTTMKQIMASGIIPVELIEAEVVPATGK